MHLRVSHFLCAYFSGYFMKQTVRNSETLILQHCDFEMISIPKYADSNIFALINQKLHCDLKKNTTVA